MKFIILGCLIVVFILLCSLAYTPDKSRIDIEARHRVVPSDYVEIAGMKVRLLVTGHQDAPAVVLLHGFGSSLETWDAWVPTLSREFRVVRFDWPGFGLSGLDPANDYSDTRSLVVLSSVLDKLDIRRATLIGNSMGGKLAWMFAAQHPDKVDKLVLISPDGFASKGFDYGKAQKVPFTMRLLPYVLPRSLVRMSLAPAYGDPSKLSDETVDRYRNLMLAPGVRSAMIARMEQVVLQAPQSMLRKIQAPTLILWGEKDGMIPFSNSADYVRLVPNAYLVALPEIGHVPQEEAPERTLSPVRAFLTAPRQLPSGVKP